MAGRSNPFLLSDDGTPRENPFSPRAQENPFIPRTRGNPFIPTEGAFAGAPPVPRIPQDRQRQKAPQSEAPRRRERLAAMRPEAPTPGPETPVAPEPQENPFSPKTRENPFAPTAGSGSYWGGGTPTDQNNAVSKTLTRAMRGMGGAAGAALEFLDRPRSAIVAAAGQAAGKLPSGAVTRAVSGDEHYSWGDLLPDMPVFGRPPEGMDPKDTMQWLKDTGGVSTPTGKDNPKWAIGLLADMMLDPLWMLGVGRITPAGRAAKTFSGAMDGLAAAHTDDVGRALGLSDEILSAARAGDTAATGQIRSAILRDLGAGEGQGVLFSQIPDMMTAAGYSPEVTQTVMDVARKGGVEFGRTLADRVARGQQRLLTVGVGDHRVGLPAAVEQRIANAATAGHTTAADSPFGKYFLTTTGRPELDDALEQLETAHRRETRQILEAAEKTRADIDALPPGAFGKGRSSAGWYEREGGVRIDRGESLAGNLSDADKIKGSMADRVHDLQEKQLSEMKRRGIPVGDVSGGEYAYAPHILAKDAATTAEAEALGFGPRVAGPSKYTPRSQHREVVWIDDGIRAPFIGSVEKRAHELGRDPKSFKTWQASVDEVNDYFDSLFRRDVQDAASPARRRRFYNPDLAEITAVSALQNEKALHGARQIENLRDYTGAIIMDFGRGSAKKFNIPEPKVDDLWDMGVREAQKLGYRSPNIILPQKFLKKGEEAQVLVDTVEKLRRTPMAPAVRRRVENAWRLVADPEEVTSSFTNLYKSYMGAWKKTLLFPFAEYHFRNMVGDLWNGWLSGWRPAHMGADLATAQKIHRGAPGKLAAPSYGEMPFEDVLLAARDHGVVGSGQFGLGELPQHLLSALSRPAETTKGKALEILKALNPVELGVKVGGYMEDSRRLALFVRRLREGDSVPEAAKFVQRVLYDYNDLTDFERQVRTFAVPFYTWYRKNIPAQFKYLATSPAKLQVVPRAKGHLERGYAVDPDDPTGDGAYRAVTPDWMEASTPIRWRELPNGQQEYMVLGNWSPNADLFKPFTGAEFLRGIGASLNPPAKTAIELALNQDLFRGRAVDTLRDPKRYLFDGGALWGNERTNYLGMDVPTTVPKLVDMIPGSRFASTADRLNPFGMFGAPRPYHDEVETASKLLKFLTGLKLYPVDTRREAQYVHAGMQRSARSEGLTQENLQKMIYRALREGDTAAVPRYMDLRKMLMERDRDAVFSVVRSGLLSGSQQQ